jgi:hypothetical protein
MSSFAHRLLEAANTVEELNHRTGSGRAASWTYQDLRHVAGSFAAEEHIDGSCPACRKRVLANDVGRICLHTDTAGKTCVASGLEFYTALAS